MSQKIYELDLEKLKNGELINLYNKLYEGQKTSSIRRRSLNNSLKSTKKLSRRLSLSNNTIKDVKIKNIGDELLKRGLGNEDFGLTIRKENISKLVIPDSIKVLNDEAFKNCSNLKTIVISDSVTNIGEFCFADCTSLKEINIPESVKILVIMLLRIVKFKKNYNT